ncbi:MAG: EAL domain-containing protein, partial [Gammaproteobacteria bacterium]|nr:EAL domain-containing protein [Gammaproteobacteria bacterium]
LEALTRWNRNGSELVAPNSFIPIAEETGLIIPMSNQILNKAVLQAKYWTQNNLLSGRTAVNISAKQFRQPDFLNRLEAVLDEANLDPSYMEIELTEAALMENTEGVITIMKTIKDFLISHKAPPFVRKLYYN